MGRSKLTYSIDILKEKLATVITSDLPVNPILTQRVPKILRLPRDMVMCGCIVSKML